MQEVYINSLVDEGVSDDIKAKILLQELRTYDKINSPIDKQYREGRYLFGSEQKSDLVYMMAVEGLVGLYNKSQENYVIGITEKGEEASKESKIPGLGRC